MGRGGGRNVDSIGVEAFWDGDDFVKGFQQYNAVIDKANKQGDAFAKRMTKAGKVSAEAFDTFSKAARADLQAAGDATKKQMVQFDAFANSARRSMRSAGQETRSYIQTAKDLQATFQEVGRTAQQFGGALRDAASGRAITQSFQSLAKESGVNTDALLSNMKAAARGTVEELDLVRIANRAMLAGGKQFAEELPRLFEIARAASIATGQDIGFVFDTLTRGIAKASPLLIDNAEIYIKVGQAVAEFAEKAGKTTDELTAQERQQATLNAVLNEGEDFINKVGSAAETATDKYDQWNVKVQEAKRDAILFMQDALGPLAPAIGAVGESLDTVLPLLQTLIILQRQGAISGTGMLGGVKGLVSSLGRFGPIALGATAGLVAYEGIVRKIDPTLQPANETISKFTDLIQLSARRFIEGTAAANEWFRAVQGLPTLVELGNQAQERNNELILEATKSYRTITQEYSIYIAAVDKANAFLKAGEIATQAMTRAQFELRQALLESGQEAAQFTETMARLTSAGLSQAEALARFREGVSRGKALEEEKAALEEALKLEKEVLKKRQELSEQSITFQEKIVEARLKLLLAEGQVQAQVEGRERDHQAKMAEIVRKGAQDRAKAQREFDKAVAAAARTRQRALEDAARKHARAVQKIERDHRRRLDEIEERFTETVGEAAIERDAIAIFEAHKRRAQEIEDANQDRSDQLNDENISFEDSKAQAERAFRDQVESARRALQERQRDIDRSIEEQREKENTAQAQRLAGQKAAQAAQLLALRQYLGQVEADYRAHLARLKALTATAPSAIIPGQRRGTPMQEGGSGVVTGPATFTVEPGVTEGFWFSGALGQRAPVLPSQEISQTVGMQAAVGGAVGVALSGFSGGLMDRIGPQMVEMVGQAVVDELTEAFTRATVRR